MEREPRGERCYQESSNSAIPSNTLTLECTACQAEVASEWASPTCPHPMGQLDAFPTLCLCRAPGYFPQSPVECFPGLPPLYAELLGRQIPPLNPRTFPKFNGALVHREVPEKMTAPVGSGSNGAFHGFMLCSCHILTLILSSLL